MCVCVCARVCVCVRVCLETEVQRQNMAGVANNLFGGWLYSTNVDSSPIMRIWIGWSSLTYQVDIQAISG